MSRTEEVVCDGCSADLTTRSNSMDYRLVLASESKPGRGPGFYTDMMIYPPIDRTHHFCNLTCLDHWRDRERHYNKLHRERSDKWAEERRTRHSAYVSYPCPPEDVLTAWEEECRAASLAEFPVSKPRSARPVSAEQKKTPVSPPRPKSGGTE